MIDYIINKHVQIGLACGTVLEGFVSRVKGNFLNLVENDNTLVIVNSLNINFVRFRGTVECCEHTPQNYERKMYHAKEEIGNGKFGKNRVAVVVRNQKENEFSMPNPNVDGLDSPYKTPSFIRTTEKE